MELIRRGRTRGGSLTMTTLLFCTYLCIFSTSALFSNNSNGDSPSDRGKTSRTAAFIQGKGMREMGGPGGGPGSYPPRCTSKCGDCSPCYPVHVPVPPGTPVIADTTPRHGDASVAISSLCLNHIIIINIIIFIIISIGW